jgi:hypothetical protein
MLKYTIVGAESSKLPPLECITIGGVPHTVEYAAGPTLPPARPSEPVEQRGQASAAPAIYTLETKPENEGQQTALQKLKQNRSLCLETANLLEQMADFDFKNPLHKAADKIRNCSLAGAFRSLDNGVNYKIGQALCRNRLCPNCQRVLAAKRRASFMEWLELNEHPLKGYQFYHMVLTVRHSAANKLRAGLYTGELLSHFAALRGAGKASDPARVEWWNKRVSGGVYSVELAPGKTDVSAHIHIHVTLFCAPGTLPVYRKDRPSEFVKEATKIWRKLTKDPKGQSIFIEPVYYKNEAGEKQVYKKGQPTELLYKAVAECMKYTLKSDESSLSGYTPEFLQELLTTPNRYYGRFGVLHARTVSPVIFVELERLNTNFQDLEQLKAKELETLYNPETGVVHQKSETRIALSYFRNTKFKEAPLASNHSIRGEKNRGGEKYYQFRDLSKVGFLHPDQENAAALYLARTIRATYDESNDLASVE